ncbi:hypothetical protein [Clostridium gasigenes]|uniref:hypothetical protein n=1 Tax=Clostridium gasigenes TaxID=94869 RepID=UPI001C0B71DB|nr:hypothetical protein [Clostridium gasigenes]MBU3104240.1 hypothetical protein [Clostridium gasigenes]MBU3136782.1 hypothetical protein [Clostridium gasigenes]
MLNFDIEVLSKEIYKFTSGYPFLVSRICEIIDENILKNRDKAWDEFHIQKAMKILLGENNTLFDDLIKNNDRSYEYMYNLLILNIASVFNIDNTEINLGVMFGYLSKNDNNTIVSNKIIRERI